MDSLDLHARQVTEAMESLTPQVDELRQGLTGVQDFLTKELHAALHQSATSVREGFENAAHLQQLITVLLKTVMDGNSQVASAQEQSLERVTLKASDGMAVFVNAMAAAVASSASLQNEIVSNKPHSYPRELTVGGTITPSSNRTDAPARSAGAGKIGICLGSGP